MTSVFIKGSDFMDSGPSSYKAIEKLVKSPHVIVYY